MVRDVSSWGFSCYLSYSPNGQTIDVDFEVQGGQACHPPICPMEHIELEPIGGDFGIGVDIIYLVDDSLEINLASFPDNTE